MDKCPQTSFSSAGANRIYPGGSFSYLDISGEFLDIVGRKALQSLLLKLFDLKATHIIFAYKPLTITRHTVQTER